MAVKSILDDKSASKIESMAAKINKKSWLILAATDQSQHPIPSLSVVEKRLYLLSKVFLQVERVKRFL